MKIANYRFPIQTHVIYWTSSERVNYYSRAYVFHYLTGFNHTDTVSKDFRGRRPIIPSALIMKKI